MYLLEHNCFGVIYLLQFSGPKPDTPHMTSKCSTTELDLDPQFELNNYVILRLNFSYSRKK